MQTFLLPQGEIEPRLQAIDARKLLHDSISNLTFQDHPLSPFESIEIGLGTKRALECYRYFNLEIPDSRKLVEDLYQDEDQDRDKPIKIRETVLILSLLAGIYSDLQLPKEVSEYREAGIIVSKQAKDAIEFIKRREAYKKGIEQAPELLNVINFYYGSEVMEAFSRRYNLFEYENKEFFGVSGRGLTTTPIDLKRTRQVEALFEEYSLLLSGGFYSYLRTPIKNENEQNNAWQDLRITAKNRLVEFLNYLKLKEIFENEDARKNFPIEHLDIVRLYLLDVENGSFVRTQSQVSLRNGLSLNEKVAVEFNRLYPGIQVEAKDVEFTVQAIINDINEINMTLYEVIRRRRIREELATDKIGENSIRIRKLMLDLLTAYHVRPLEGPDSLTSFGSENNISISFLSRLRIFIEVLLGKNYEFREYHPEIIREFEAFWPEGANLPDKLMRILNSYSDPVDFKTISEIASDLNLLRPIHEDYIETIINLTLNKVPTFDQQLSERKRISRYYYYKYLSFDEYRRSLQSGNIPDMPVLTDQELKILQEYSTKPESTLVDISNNLQIDYGLLNFKISEITIKLAMYFGKPEK